MSSPVDELHAQEHLNAVGHDILAHASRQRWSLQKRIVADCRNRGQRVMIIIDPVPDISPSPGELDLPEEIREAIHRYLTRQHPVSDQELPPESGAESDADSFWTSAGPEYELDQVIWTITESGTELPPDSVPDSGKPLRKKSGPTVREKIMAAAGVDLVPRASLARIAGCKYNTYFTGEVAKLIQDGYLQDCGGDVMATELLIREQSAQ